MASIWHENMLGYLSADVTFSEKRKVFRERSSKKTISFEEQIMSKDKYPYIFSPQMEAIVKNPQESRNSHHLITQRDNIHPTTRA